VILSSSDPDGRSNSSHAEPPKTASKSAVVANWWKRNYNLFGIGQRASIQLRRKETPIFGPWQSVYGNGKLSRMTTAELLTSALSLPLQERAALAHDLIASLDAEEADPRAETLWADELARRSREVLEGKADLIDSGDVHAEAAMRLRARAGR
jgi:hypothetical protein